MNYRHLLLLSLVIFFLKAQGQAIGEERKNKATISGSNFQGWIKDAETGQPLPGATIYFPEIKKGAIADTSGFFRFTGLPKSNLLFEITYQGYKSYSETINPSDSLKTWLLDPLIVEQQEVTVTGVSFATRLRQNPQPITVINKAGLFSTPSTNLMEALSKKIPGFSVVTTGPAIAKPFIRGLGYNRVVTIEDGVKQEGQQWGDEHGVEIDDNSIQRIEVVKGPASLIYGSDAIAGVINIQSQIPAPQGTIRANVISEYQTNNNLVGTYGQIGATKNGFSWNAYGNYKAARDYSNKYDGKVFNSRFINKDAGAMAGYSGPWGYSRLYFTHYNLKAGIVEGARDSASGKFVETLPDGSSAIVTNFNSAQPAIPYQQIAHLKLTLDNNFNLGSNRLELIGAYQQNRRQEFGDAADPREAETDMNLQTVNYGLKWRLPSQKSWKTAIGINGMYQNNENFGNETVIPDYHLFDAGIYVFSQYIRNAISVSGGLRFDTRSLSASGMENSFRKSEAFKRNFANISGSLGLTWKLKSDVFLKANLARGFRAPNLAELGSNGEHEGTARYEVGNKDLRSETSLQGDLGLEVQSNHLAFRASVFYNSIGNFIYYSKVYNENGTDSVIKDPTTGHIASLYKYRMGNAYLFGGEFYLDLHPHPLDWLHFENTFSYTVGKFRNAVDGSNNLPLIPPAKWVSELRSKFYPNGETIRNLFISVSGDYSFDQNRPFTGYGTETSTAGFFLLNSALGMEVMHRDKLLFSFVLSASNLANTTYQSHLSRLKYTDVNEVTGRRGVFETGRNFSLKVNIPFEGKS